MAKSKVLSQVLTDIDTVIENLDNGSLGSRSAIKSALEEILFKHRGGKLVAQPGEYELYFPNENTGVPWCRKLEEMVNEFISTHPKVSYPEDLYVQFLNYWSTPDSYGHPAWWRLVNTKKAGKKGTFFVPGRLSTFWQNYRPSKSLPNAELGKTLGSAKGINSAIQDLLDKGLVKTGKDFQ